MAEQTATNNNNIDNILKKYSNTNSTANKPTLNPQSSVNEGVLIDLIDLGDLSPQNHENSNNNNKNSSTLTPGLAAPSAQMTKNLSSVSLQQQKNNILFYNPENLEASKLFLDAKKKLRLVFSWSDYCIYNFISPNNHK
jgi:hypothetical protein